MSGINVFIVLFFLAFMWVWKFSKKKKNQSNFHIFVNHLLFVSDFKIFSLSLEFCCFAIIYSIWFSFYLSCLRLLYVFNLRFVPCWFREILTLQILILTHSFYYLLLLLQLDLYLTISLYPMLPLMSHIFCVYLGYIMAVLLLLF